MTADGEELFRSPAREVVVQGFASLPRYVGGRVDYRCLTTFNNSQRKTAVVNWIYRQLGPSRGAPIELIEIECNKGTERGERCTYENGATWDNGLALILGSPSSLSLIHI